MKRTLLAALAAACAGPALAITVVVGTGAPSPGAPSPAAAFLASVEAAFTAGTPGALRVVERTPAGAVAAVQTCSVDAALLPSRELADGLVAEGDGTARTPVFRTDTVLAGPPSDPAGARNAGGAARALAAIAAAEAPFHSHPAALALEMALWNAASVDPRPARGAWWREVPDAAAALAAAAGAPGYALAERAALAAHPARDALAILVEGEPALAVTHHLVPVSRTRCRAADTEAAARLAEWLRGVDGAVAMAAFTIGGDAPILPLGPGAAE